MKNILNINNEINDFLLDDRKSIENEFSCVLCKKLVFKIIVLQCRNGDWFCKNCAETTVLEKRQCLTCKIPINSTNELNRNKFIENSFNNKLVACPYSFSNLFKDNIGDSNSNDKGSLVKDEAFGCKEIIKIGEFDEHLDKCQFRFIKCLNSNNNSNNNKNNDTNDKMISNNNNNNNNNNSTTINGQDNDNGICNKIIRFNQIKDHELECKYSTNKCISCQVKTRKGELENHIKNECQNTIIECKYKEYGCNSTFKRKDLSSHLEKVNHTNFMTALIQEYSEELKELKEKLEESNKKCNEILTKSMISLNPIIIKSLESSKSYKNLWTILKYSSKREKSFVSPDIRLPPFTFSFSTSEKSDYLRIYLKEVNQNIVNCDFSVCLLNYHDPTNSIEKSLSWKFSDGKGFGWNKFVKISEIEEKGFISDDDKLTLEISLIIKPEEMEPLITE